MLNFNEVDCKLECKLIIFITYQSKVPANYRIHARSFNLYSLLWKKNLSIRVKRKQVE